METDGKNVQQNYWIQIRHRNFVKNIMTKHEDNFKIWKIYIRK